ncbi:MAG TPA: sugar phosphate nucleotidyltransferase [Syntrophomonadaceae bacterium]|nr:sugar phosphate nucleotidyltransferase [Syntrophomonadaceae bacterium]
MKAVVLSGGSGTRLLPLTKYYPKQLLPVGGKPVLHWVIEDILQTGIREIIIVTSPESRERITASLQESFKGRAALTFIVQERPRGLAQAVSLVQNIIENEEFLLYLGDNMVFDNIAIHLVNNNTSPNGVVIAVKEVAEASQYGVVEISPCGKVVSLEEKPSRPRSNLAIMGIYRLPGDIFDFIAQLDYSQRGELEITDAINALLVAGRPMSVYHYSGEWFDIGSPVSLLEANHRFLEKQINLSINPKASLISTRISEPVYAGRNSRVYSSNLGPGCIIGNNCILKNVELNNCLVMDHTCIQNIKAQNKIFTPEFVCGV